MDLVGEDDELFGLNDIRSRKVVEKLSPEEWKLSFPPQLNTSVVSYISLPRSNIGSIQSSTH